MGGGSSNLCQLFVFTYSIDEPYDLLVGTNKEGFLVHIRGQLADLFNTELKNIPLEDMDARSGSTIVTMKVLGYTDEEAAELETSYADLAEMFENGDVQIVTSENKHISLVLSNAVSPFGFFSLTRMEIH